MVFDKATTFTIVDLTTRFLSIWRKLVVLTMHSRMALLQTLQFHWPQVTKFPPPHPPTTRAAPATPALG
jgi:hypothetical protein